MAEDTTTTENTGLREALETAYEEKSAETPENEAVEDNTEAQEAEPAEAVEPETEKEETSPEKTSLKDELDKNSPKSDEKDQKRDEKGRFEGKEAIKAAEKVGQPLDSEAKTEKDPLARAPEAWKPEAREYWKDIPEEAKKEIIRHNQLVYDTLDKTTSQRKFAEAVAQTVKPYQATIEAEGGSVVKAIGDLMQTAQALRTSPPPHKAQLVAGLIKQFGVDINQLDQALIGATPQQDPIAQRIEQEMAPVRQWQQQMAQQQQQAQQQEEQALERTVQEFYATEPEFLNDVRDRMVEMYDGKTPLQEVYEEACWATPSVRQVMLQRQETQRLQAQSAVATKAKNAAVSVGGAPSVGAASQETPNSIREALELAVSRNVR